MKKVLLIGVFVLVVGLILVTAGVTFLGEEVEALWYHDGFILLYEDAHTEPNIPATVAGIVVSIVGGYLIFTSRGTPPQKLKGGT